jgi:hypothetical protein
MSPQGRDSAQAQHRDNNPYTSLVLDPFSVVFTIDPIDILRLSVASIHWEVQHAIALCPIPTSSCVLAFISNNKGMLNSPALQSAFLNKISLSLSRLLVPSPQIFGALFSVCHCLRSRTTPVSNTLLFSLFFYYFFLQ